MKKTISLSIILLICCINSLAQTTTFNYLTSGLDPNDCNVFYSPRGNISGYYHDAYAGGG